MINQPPMVMCNLIAPVPVPDEGSINNILTATSNNAVNYVWTIVGDGWIITAGQGTSTIAYTAGSGGATFSLVVTDSHGCTDSCGVVVGHIGFEIPLQKDSYAHAEEIILMKAFPNPFENTTTIEFTTKADADVNVSVYTITGDKVMGLFNGLSKADLVNRVVFNGTDLPDGIYIYKIQVDDKVYFDRLVLLK
jgi:hypothetical protein